MACYRVRVALTRPGPDGRERTYTRSPIVTATSAEHAKAKAIAVLGGDETRVASRGDEARVVEVSLLHRGGHNG